MFLSGGFALAAVLLIFLAVSTLKFSEQAGLLTLLGIALLPIIIQAYLAKAGQTSKKDSLNNALDAIKYIPSDFADFIRSNRGKKLIASDKLDIILGPNIQALEIDTFIDFLEFIEDSFDLVHFYAYAPALPNSGKLQELLIKLDQKGKSVIYTFTSATGYDDFWTWKPNVEEIYKVDLPRVIGLALPEKSLSSEQPAVHSAFLYKVTQKGALKHVHGFNTALEIDSALSKMYGLIPVQRRRMHTRFSIAKIKEAIEAAKTGQDDEIIKALQLWLELSSIRLWEFDPVEDTEAEPDEKSLIN